MTTCRPPAKSSPKLPPGREDRWEKYRVLVAVLASVQCLALVDIHQNRRHSWRGAVGAHSVPVGDTLSPKFNQIPFGETRRCVHPCQFRDRSCCRICSIFRWKSNKYGSAFLRRPTRKAPLIGANSVPRREHETIPPDLGLVVTVARNRRRLRRQYTRHEKKNQILEGLPMIHFSNICRNVGQLKVPAGDVEYRPT